LEDVEEGGVGKSSSAPFLVSPSKAAPSTSLQLPAWVFDVDVDDDVFDDGLGEQGILEEFGIDLWLIYRVAKWTLLRPLASIFRRMAREPFPLSTVSTAEQTNGWGPTLIGASITSVLWACRVPSSGYVLAILMGASLFQHLVSRSFIENCYIGHHFALLSYGSFPVLICSILIMIMRPSVAISLAMELCAVLWCTLAAYTAYIDMFVETTPPEKRNRFALLIYPALLTFAYIICLVPLFKS
jgi:hypothetical protein